MNSATVSPARHTQRRIEGAFYIFGAVFLVLAGRVIYLQAVPSATGFTDKIFEKEEKLPARRGQVLASDLTAMAVTLDEYTVAANPRVWTQDQKKHVAKILASKIGGTEAAHLAQLSRITSGDGSKKFYVKLAERVPEEKVESLRAIMGPPKKKQGQREESRKERTERIRLWEPLTLEPSPRRNYPLKSFAPQLIGFTDRSGHGVDGMEKAFDKELSGTDGIRDSLVDPRGRAVPGTINTWKMPVDGHSVVTTIDPRIQAAADASMKKAFEQFRPNFCVTVVMKPRTGEIVAISTAPQFDLNNRPANIAEIATNRAFSFAYEPGSTWKIITAAAAVEKVPDWQNKRFFINGAASVGRHTIHDWQFWSGKVRPEDKGLSEGIRDSSNVCMYRFAQQMPRGTLLEYAKKFGIGQKPDLEGFNLHPGYVPRNDPKEWSEAQFANFAFGQGMMLTPLQLARMGAVIANDGVMMKPMLVKEIRDARGKVIKTNLPKSEGRVIAASTAKHVAKMLHRVVYEGTARRYIFIPGYSSGGKTGSAQKAEGRKGYVAGKFISSFVGFLPMEKPEYVIAVMADEPRGSHWGSEVCGPPFTEVAQEAMVQMRLALGTNAPAPNPAWMKRPQAPKA